MTLRNLFRALTLSMLALSAGTTLSSARPPVFGVDDLVDVLMRDAAPAETPPRPPTTVSDTIGDPRPYTIDGHALGERLDPGSLAAFDCQPSEQFITARWCRNQTAVHAVRTVNAVLLASDGSIQYYGKYYPAAVFPGGAVASEIRRLSALYREQPRLLRLPGGTGLDGVIAVWGSMVLSPLDQATQTQLAAGQPVTAGILVDFLGKAGESARRGLPVYRLSGGPGYFWAARFDARGQGTLRLGMGDPSVYDRPAPVAAPARPDTPSAASEARPDADAALAEALAQQAAAEQASRLRQEDEARRAKIAEAQAARDAAASQLKAARLAAAGETARRRLDEAVDFVRANRDDPQLLDHLQRIADLKGALASGDPEPVERKTDELTAGFATDPAYRAYAAHREAERQRETAHDLDEAVKALTFQKRFLIDALAQDPTAPEAGHLLDLAKQVDATVAAADLPRAQTLVGTIDAAIRKADLSKSFEAAKLTGPGVPAAAPAPAPPPVAAAAVAPTPPVPLDRGPDR